EAYSICHLQQLSCTACKANSSVCVAEAEKSVGRTWPGISEGCSCAADGAVVRGIDSSPGIRNRSHTRCFVQSPIGNLVRTADGIQRVDIICLRISRCGENPHRQSGNNFAITRYSQLS